MSRVTRRVEDRVAARWISAVLRRAGQPAVDRLTEEVGQRKLSIVSGARISEVSLDQSIKPEAFVQLARQ